MTVIGVFRKGYKQGASTILAMVEDYINGEWNSSNPPYVLYDFGHPVDNVIECEKKDLVACFNTVVMDCVHLLEKKLPKWINRTADITRADGQPISPKQGVFQLGYIRGICDATVILENHVNDMTDDDKVTMLLDGNPFTPQIHSIQITEPTLRAHASDAVTHIINDMRDTLEKA
ncbi:hypothetical protein [Bifidobacterium moukalabense]|uniref:hypothetical protein n=1 Tax=Bifidobacterium moukalabense TaxID=1333651 RepID=UPI0010F88066|nr:hypothetical protein [Bifidobacterium moukalabense]